MVDREDIIELVDQKPADEAGLKIKQPKAKGVFLFLLTTLGTPVLGLMGLIFIPLLLMLVGGVGEWFYNWLIATFR